MDVIESDWKVDCSDDENYGFTYSELCKQWLPNPETLIQLLDNFNSDKTCDLKQLDWVCPGRKDINAKEDDGDIDNEEHKPEEKSDFDFWDEPNASSKPGPSRAGPGLSAIKQPRGSAKKKTTSLDGILSSMRRHRKMDQMDKNTPTNTLNPPPKTS